MATIVLTALGGAIGASVGGSVLGLSSMVIGRAVGAALGRSIDQKLLGGGSQPVETGKVDRLRLTGVSEGTAVPQVFGRFRTGGQVIWASKVTEHRNAVADEPGGGAGKGFLSGGQSDAVEYSYSASIALALCEGEITHVGRVWADGEEIAPRSLTMRVYPGSEDQLPDPALSAALGAANAPAFRGTAYVVVENLDLTRFGNRIPVLNFEVFRPEQPGETPGTARGTKAVAMIPGTGEYALASEKVHFGTDPGERIPANVNTPLDKTDLSVSLEMMDGELPDCEAVSLVVCWFGTDLRAGQCEIAPRVDQKARDGIEMPWVVSGLVRADAGVVPYEDDKAIYGGTPTDQSVKQALRGLANWGKKATFYPFILMEQKPANGLTDPWTGAPGQPAYPWRGRITTALAPGQPGSPDGTQAAVDEVAAFMGQAQASDFQVTEDTVTYTGPEEWSYRRFILHYAHLCAQVGGIEAFLIGSELRALTQIRGPGNSFPMVAGLRQLAADVRAILGPEVKVSYAADWSEYFGYQPADGSGDVFYHLDPLWADPNIDFIGIDNYMRLSDWRDGEDHADAHWGAIHNLDYLKSNVMGGEGFDWYYESDAARDLQLRSPIEDGAHGEPWVYRYKDIRNWWMKQHHERIGGQRRITATDWEPGMKPIWFTELGCAAIDKGTNEPNKFLDPKSSESALPVYSTGHRDDFIQAQYLRATREFWADPVNNPVHPTTGQRMIDMDRAFVWAWDARPFPWFPNRADLWGDWANYDRGHWLNGRASMRTLESVVREVCARSGVTEVDTSRLYGSLRGYMVSDVGGGRAALQPLMTAYGFEAAERDGTLAFFTRSGRADAALDTDRLAVSPELAGDLELSRAPVAEMTGRVRLNYVEARSGYETRAAEAVFADEETHAVEGAEVALVLNRSEAVAITEGWLAQARVSQDRARFALPPSNMAVRAGDVVSLDIDSGPALFRVDHVEQNGLQLVQAVRVEPLNVTPDSAQDRPIAPPAHRPTVPVQPIWLDLPWDASGANAHKPHIAAVARPWPGPVAAYASARDDGYKLDTVLRTPARFGLTETVLPPARPGLIDNGPALRVRMLNGALSSAGTEEMLAGANLAAIGTGGPDGWEIFQFRQAVLVAEGIYEITGRLRGQGGSDPFIADPWPDGSWVVFLDGAIEQVNLPRAARGLERHYRIGPASQPMDDDSYVHEVVTTEGVGLRPYRPVHLRAAASGGDTAFRWIRRTRIDGDSWQGVEVPLGEDTESYRVRVRAGGSLRREVFVDTPGWTYTAAQKVADGVTGAYRVEVAQISQSFGPGPAARLSLS